MVVAPHTISLLGATGTIGDNTLSVIRAHPGRFKITALTAQRNVEKLAGLAREFQPELAVIGDEALYPELKNALSGTPVRAGAGAEALREAASLPSSTVMAGMVGMAGLPPLLPAIERGARIALANKESLVCGGDWLLEKVRTHGATLIPVDSEHSAIFQLLDGRGTDGVETIAITASGGPCLRKTREEMALVTPGEAVKHPNWRMGAKISVDSATLMNKGLEWIEACYLFDVAPERIRVIVHPESIVHGLVTYRDGSTLAQLSPPDMKTPIACALGWPERIAAPVTPLDLTALGKLTFEPVDESRFPSLRLAREAFAEERTIALNAANEVAVANFLDRKIAFPDIFRVVEQVLNDAPVARADGLDAILAADREARGMALSLLHSFA